MTLTPTQTELALIAGIKAALSSSGREIATNVNLCAKCVFSAGTVSVYGTITAQRR
jgi:hypothetical protein